MNYAAVAVVLSAVFMLGFVVGVVFGRWVPENRPEIHVATLDELRTELRSIQDEPWTDQQLSDWKETVGEAFRDAIAKQNRDPENPDARKLNAESALNELSILVELTERVLKLEQAASEFHGRLFQIEDRLSPTVATAVAPQVDFWQEYARKASDAVQEKIATATLPDDEEVAPGFTRRELNESNAAAKLFGQLLRDARLQSNGVAPLIDPETIEEYESGGLLPYPETLDALIAAYRPSADFEKQIRDAWTIAQKPYLGRLYLAETKTNQES